MRNRKVRLSYPAAYVELVLLMAQRHGMRKVAEAFGLPLSTLYRWRERAPAATLMASASPEVVSDSRMGEIVNACAAHGFDVKRIVDRLEPGFARARRISMPAHEANPVVREVLVYEHALSTHMSAGTAVHQTDQRRRLGVVRDEIESHFYSRLSCTRLAQMAGMSRFAFIRAFRAAFGISPYRYLMSVRIRHARILLGNSSQPLNAIAAAVGFDSESCFVKAFRRIEGVSLSQRYRGMRLGVPAVQSHAASRPSMHSV